MHWHRDSHCLQITKIKNVTIISWHNSKNQSQNWRLFFLPWHCLPRPRRFAGFETVWHFFIFHCNDENAIRTIGRSVEDVNAMRRCICIKERARLVRQQVRACVTRCNVFFILVQWSQNNFDGYRSPICWSTRRAFQSEPPISFESWDCSSCFDCWWHSIC